ncbi:hypothetical protein HKX48_004482 [Thoreauomyces humboldtii]|nr:hypothetical protein HKX48_004482 [Thoreauomyces humboldtii]
MQQPTWKKKKKAFDPDWIAGINPPGFEEILTCESCCEDLGRLCYSKVQRTKGERRRCLKCVAEYEGTWASFCKSKKYTPPSDAASLGKTPLPGMGRHYMTMERRVAAYNYPTITDTASEGWGEIPSDPDPPTAKPAASASTLTACTKPDSSAPASGSAYHTMQHTSSSHARYTAVPQTATLGSPPGLSTDAFPPLSSAVRKPVSTERVVGSLKKPPAVPTKQTSTVVNHKHLSINQNNTVTPSLGKALAVTAVGSEQVRKETAEDAFSKESAQVPALPEKASDQEMPPATPSITSTKAPQQLTKEVSVSPVAIPPSNKTGKLLQSTGKLASPAAEPASHLASAQEVTYERHLIRMFQLISIKKRKDIHTAAAESKVHVICRNGVQGLILVEGSSADIQRFLKRIETHKPLERAKEKVKASPDDGTWRKLRSRDPKHPPDDILFEEVQNLKDFIERLQDCGLVHLYEEHVKEQGK